MHLAAAEGRLLAVSYLLGVSANPNTRDRLGGFSGWLRLFLERVEATLSGGFISGVFRHFFGRVQSISGAGGGKFLGRVQATFSRGVKNFFERVEAFSRAGSGNFLAG